MRTPGRLIDDRLIEFVASRQIAAADERLAASHINVASHHGIVLLTGQVQSEALRARAEQVAADMRRVRKVHNEIEVIGSTNFVTRANDNWLTTKVFSRLAASEDVDANRIKVVTENGIVYLLGVVPRSQADAAAEVARTVFGVGKVVKAFDYL